VFPLFLNPNRTSAWQETSARNDTTRQPMPIVCAGLTNRMLQDRSGCSRASQSKTSFTLMIQDRIPLQSHPFD
jgi:hypothetical protein